MTNDITLLTDANLSPKVLDNSSMFFPQEGVEQMVEPLANFSRKQCRIGLENVYIDISIDENAKELIQISKHFSRYNKECERPTAHLQQ